MIPYAMSITSSVVQKAFLRSFKTYSRSLKYFRVLGIETSCDDTAAAIVDSDKNILGEARFSQADIHSLHGGILPNFAETLHKNHIKNIVQEALEKSKLTVNELDAIAATVKPGMICNLAIGLDYAKDLCTLFSKPLIPIHHMEAHALTIRLLENVEFPFLVLLISGGHCILALAESIMKFIVLAESENLAPGSILDKLSRRLKLSNLKDFRQLCGGVAIEKAAKEGNPFAMKFNPVHLTKRFSFKFSGYVTTIYKYINEKEQELGITGDKLLPNVHDVCASLQYGMMKYLSERVELGINYLERNAIFEGKEKALVISGGVASNDFIKEMLTRVCDNYDFKLLAPPKSLCADNGVMIAWNGIEKLMANLPSVPPNELGSVTCEARSPLGEHEPNIGEYIWKGKFVDLKTYLVKRTHEEQSTNSLHEKDIIKN